MKTPRLHYFKQNTAELPEGYRKPIKRRRKPPVLECQPIVVPKPKSKSKPVIRRRTPRGRLMPLRMKNEWIPRNADWCQINGQKVRQDIFFGEVVGRVFIPGLFTGEACGSCGPSMFDFGGGCGDGGCEGGCDGGGGGGGGGGEGCEGEGCGTGGAACEGCAGCEGEGCASAGCESSGCEASGCSTGGGGGCDTGCTGCAGEGCGQGSGQGAAGCEGGGCTGASGCGESGCGQGGCDTSGGCESSCASTGCADTGCDTGCGMGCDAGCATACAETGCGMGCVAPASDFGGWGPTAGVDYTGAGPGWGAGPNTSNTGLGNTIGAPSWATGDFGTYGVGGPTGTGLGPGAPGASIGGPGVYAQSPGVTGFPGDFGAPVGGAIGMTGNVGTQVGPGMLGGPGSVQQGEGLGPGGFGIAPAAPSAPTAAPGDRSDIAPSQNFGPQTASSQSLMDTIAAMFGPSQAQAQTSNFMNTQDTFGRAAEMLAQQTQNNPALLDALQQIVAEHNAPPAAPNAPVAAPTFDPNSRADPQDLPHGQLGPGFVLSDPNVTPGQQNFAPGKTGEIVDDPGAREQGYQQLAQQMTEQQNQQDMITAQELGEQGKGLTSPAQTVANAFNDLAGKGLTQSEFDSRYGPENQFAPTQEAPTRGSPDDPDVPPAENQQIGLTRGQDVISNLDPATRGVGREAAPLGLLDMFMGLSRGSPAGNPYQAGANQFGAPATDRGSTTSSGRGSTTSGGRSGGSFTSGPFSSGRGSPSSGGRDAGYYNTGGRGIAPGAKGAEYGGMYGPGVATGRAGTNTFGIDSRSGAYGFYDPVTGLYYR